MAETRDASATTCPRCSNAVPEVGRFCPRCGADARATTPRGQQRKGAFAAHPGEPLASVNVVSSLMPLSAGTGTQTYRWALTFAVAVPVLAAVFGFLPFALAAAALAMPVVYLVYLYDVNEWEDQPIPVVAGTVALAGALALGFTLLWRDTLLDGPLAFRVDANAGFSVETKVLLVVGLLVPVVSVLLQQIGPLWLVAKRRFDDLIDGLTFGIAAGVAFAAVETIVLNSGLIFDGPGRVEDPNAAVWVSIVVIAGLIKPVVYGSAAGIACAGFSGLGEGHDGFKAPYFRALAEAIVANIAFQVGVYLTGRLGGTVGVMLGLLWALVVAGVLLVRVRVILQHALLEGALEATARGDVPAMASHGAAYCAECELPLLDDASFCVACGTSVRAASKPIRQANASADVDPTSVAATRRTAAAMVVVAVVVVALVGGVFAAINAGTRPDDEGPRRFEQTAGEEQGRALGSKSVGGQRGDIVEGGGSTVEIFGDVVVTVPRGWDVVKSGDQFVIESTDGAMFRVISGTTSESDTPVSVLQNLFDEVISQEVQDLDGTSQEIDPPVDTVIGAEGLPFTGNVATNQGAVAVEGYAEALFTESGLAITCDSLNVAGEFDAHVDDFNVIYSSVLQSIGGTAPEPDEDE